MLPDLSPSSLLNPHSTYGKIDAYLLQFLCHMTSDVNFSHILFFLSTLLFKSLFYEVKERQLLNKH